MPDDQTQPQEALMLPVWLSPTGGFKHYTITHPPKKEAPLFLFVCFQGNKWQKKCMFYTEKEMHGYPTLAYLAHFSLAEKKKQMSPLHKCIKLIWTRGRSRLINIAGNGKLPLDLMSPPPPQANKSHKGWWVGTRVEQTVIPLSRAVVLPCSSLIQLLFTEEKKAPYPHRSIIITYSPKRAVRCMLVEPYWT